LVEVLNNPAQELELPNIKHATLRAMDIIFIVVIVSRTKLALFCAPVHRYLVGTI